MASSLQSEKRATMLRAETKSLLQSPDFARSPVMSQLLNYLVEEAISNPDRPPKAYQVAVDGLGRAEDFDVQIDSYPRVQVGRLRKMLAAHYAARGSEERLRIPMGHYAVEIQMDDGEPPEKQSGAELNVHSLFATAPAEITMDRWFSNRQTTLGLATFLLITGVILAWLLNTATRDSSGVEPVSQYYTLAPKIYFSLAQETLSENERGKALEIGQFLENAFARSSQVRLAAAELSGLTPEKDQNAYRF